jgi:hypothetical protein
MASYMVEIGSLSRSEQEDFLERISRGPSTPIEIDGSVYYIPNAVNDLIDFLYERLYSEDKHKGMDGIPDYKE